MTRSKSDPPADVRAKIRASEWTGPTLGLAPGFLQANLVVLPDDLADSIVYIGTGEAPGTWTVEDAVIDEVMIWDKALTEDEVNEMMLGDVMAVSYGGKLTTTWADIKQQ